MGHANKNLWLSLEYADNADMQVASAILMTPPRLPHSFKVQYMQM